MSGAAWGIARLRRTAGALGGGLQRTVPERLHHSNGMGAGRGGRRCGDGGGPGLGQQRMASPSELSLPVRAMAS
eukprot:9027255-Lingulodinium_polyedra.AAC.1